ncbi:hypothetical protein PoB_005573500 [Plakobranchus ocellatus]|uniref:Ig-like domain-containing protein n=1 Tax=Plakobranchus ocellatus TaxID=259542 RepID=A0AAV4C942_9GAST|nr:hypothetical protein PoB_005573500 [Plakobranchus ocellatus]
MGDPYHGNAEVNMANSNLRFQTPVNSLEEISVYPAQALYFGGKITVKCRGRIPSNKRLSLEVSKGSNQRATYYSDGSTHGNIHKYHVLDKRPDEWYQIIDVRCARFMNYTVEFMITEEWVKSETDCCIESLCAKHLQTRLANYTFKRPDVLVDGMPASAEIAPIMGTEIITKCTAYLGRGMKMSFGVVYQEEVSRWFATFDYAGAATRIFNHRNQRINVEQDLRDSHPQYGYVLNATLKITITPNLEEARIVCYPGNGTTDFLRDLVKNNNTNATWTKPMSIKYLSETPTLKVQYKRPSKVLVAGETLNATCEALVGTGQTLVWELITPPKKYTWKAGQNQQFPAWVNITFKTGMYFKSADNANTFTLTKRRPTLEATRLVMANLKD